MKDLKISKVIVISAALVALSTQQGATTTTENKCTPGKCAQCAQNTQTGENFCVACFESVVAGDQGQTYCLGGASMTVFCELELKLGGGDPFCFRCREGYWPYQETEDSSVNCQKDVVCTRGTWSTDLNAYVCNRCPNGMKLANQNGVGGCVPGGESIENCLETNQRAGGEVNCEFCKPGFLPDRGTKRTCVVPPEGQDEACGHLKVGSDGACVLCNWAKGYFAVGTTPQGLQSCAKVDQGGQGGGDGRNGGNGQDGGDGGNDGQPGEHGEGRGEGRNKNASIVSLKYISFSVLFLLAQVCF